MRGLQSQIPSGGHCRPLGYARGDKGLPLGDKGLPPSVTESCPLGNARGGGLPHVAEVPYRRRE